MLSECLGAAAGAEDVLETGLSFFTDPTYSNVSFHCVRHIFRIQFFSREMKILIVLLYLSFLD